MKLSSFFVLAKVGFSQDLAEFDSRCPDLELGQQCDTECSEVFVDCRNNCPDHLCENQCLIEFTECVSDCPCGQNCPNGCQDCENPLCTTCNNLEMDFEFQQCKVIALEEFDHCAMNCLNNWGCIDNCYNREILQGFSQCKCFDEIPSESTEYLTVLSQNWYYGSPNLGYVTNVDGGFQQNRYYSFYENSLLYAVSAVYQDNVYIFGGYDSDNDFYKTDIHQVFGCEIRKLSVTLERPVAYYTGIVATSDGVYSGFVGSNYKWTQLFDGTRTILSNYNTDADHEGGCMAHLNNQPVAIGGDGGNNVELLRSNGWTYLDSHPMYDFRQLII
ncbi:Oidioi.mRNA.OKI2018_I69.XSR.g16635.t1.cds [Oikopleura dioica]|uniref:Oidioi.mRNA.OKI2018_I69.XSR.g16635.t1.cds n=1 Tax=Oikopleura dioica TaxID=34765 RepID=A0ABN7SGS5_OIKDI|nr:Oidioi.mRNA.OKI2018_I69.XSR.g16635.t1.cds [Oikopleura dioica]